MASSRLIAKAVEVAGSDDPEDVCLALEGIARKKVAKTGEEWDEWLARCGIRTTADVRELLNSLRAAQALASAWKGGDITSDAQAE
jgi:hypothetical protein